MTKEDYINGIPQVSAPGLSENLEAHLKTDDNIAPKLTFMTLRKVEEFVMSLAENVLQRQSGYIPPATVYKWARDYFNDDMYLEDIDEKDKEEIADAIKNYVPRNPVIAKDATTEEDVAKMETTTEDLIIESQEKQKIRKPKKTKTKYIEEQMDLFG